MNAARVDAKARAATATRFGLAAPDVTETIVQRGDSESRLGRLVPGSDN